MCDGAGYHLSMADHLRGGRNHLRRTSLRRIRIAGLQGTVAAKRASRGATAVSGRGQWGRNFKSYEKLHN